MEYSKEDLIEAKSKISSRSDFIHDSGFIPTKADLVEKSTHLSW